MRYIHFLLCAVLLTGTSLHAQNLVLNGKFNNDLIGWENPDPSVSVAVWKSADANGNPLSGSVQIVNLQPNANFGVVIQQCVPVNSGQKYTVTGKVRIPSGAGQSLTNKAVMAVLWYAGPDCTTAIGSITGGASPQAFDVWVSQIPTFTARAGSHSAHVRTLLTKVPAGGSFTAQFDEITMTSPSIFTNGFE